MLPHFALRVARRFTTLPTSRGVAFSILAAVAGCGGSAAPQATTPDPAAAGPAVPATPEAPSASTTGASAPQASASAAHPTGPVADGAYDVVHGRDPIQLKPLFDKTNIPTFPPATASELECWRTTAIVGTARKDYETLLAKCGSATGAVQYTRPAIGHLHHKHQRRDVFVLPIQGGLCYRFYGVGDATIVDLDILIEQRGALVGDDKATGPVAIIQSEKAWCIDHDGVYNFLVQTHGEGHGQYVFGVWARKGTP
jgi:hypothetical protein